MEEETKFPIFFCRSCLVDEFGEAGADDYLKKLGIDAKMVADDCMFCWWEDAE